MLISRREAGEAVFLGSHVTEDPLFTEPLQEPVFCELWETKTAQVCVFSPSAFPLPVFCRDPSHFLKTTVCGGKHHSSKIVNLHLEMRAAWGRCSCLLKGPYLGRPDLSKGKTEPVPAQEMLRTDRGWG